MVRKDIPAEGQRNLLGQIREDEIFLLDSIKAKEIVSFLEA